MSYNITDYSELEIEITDTVRTWYVPKFRIFMVVDGDYCYLYWSDSEKGRPGITRKLPLDYHDVTFGLLTPTSATEVKQTIEAYQISAFPNLSGYVPYTGATADVDLGTHGLTADFVAFSQTPTTGPGHAQIGYVGATQALAYDFDNTSVRCNIGQQMYALVHNAEAITITKGQAVYLFGASGNKASVKLAYNTSDATSAKTFGLVAEDIAANQNGLIITQGVLDGINTGAYSPGDTLYLGATAGSWTATKPYAPNHLVYVGIVEKANAGNGQIYVRVQNGYELDEIHDVQITTTPSDGQVLTYEASTSLWKPKTPTTASGTVTSIATTSPITGGTITTSGTIGINNAAADGSTKGAAAFTASDFNDNGSGVISIDYTNGQAASGSNNGFLTSADWNTFNNKQATLVSGTNIKTVDGLTLLSSGNAITGTHQNIIAALGSTIKATTFPFDHGAWSFITNTVALVNQQLLLLPLYLQQTLTLTGVKIHCPNTGNYTGNNYNGVGLYTYSSGTLTRVAFTTNDANFWKPTANVVTAKPFATPYSATAGMYFLGALYCNSAQTTAPTLLNVSMGSTTTASLDFTNSAKIFGTVSTLTALPATQAMSGVTARGNGNMMFVY